MRSQNANKHLTLDERRVIRVGIENGSTCTAIAQMLGKDNSTISKEIKKHCTLKHHCSLPLECSNYKHCKYGRECTVVGKSPLQLTEFLAPDVYSRLQQFGIHQIPADEVVLKPYLLKG